MAGENVVAKISGGRIIVSSAWLCQNLPTTRKTLTTWAKSGMPKHAHGWWDLVDVLAWRGLIETNGTANKDSTALQQQKLALEIDLKGQQAELARFKNELNAKRYLPRAEVENTLTQFFVTLKKSVLMIPRRVAGEISQYTGKTEAKEIESRLIDLVSDALSQISIDGVYHGAG